MIATVQFDLDSPEDAAKFALLVGSTAAPPSGSVTSESTEYEKTAKPNHAAFVDADLDLDFPPKDDTPIMPSIEDISKLFAQCQEKDAKRSGMTIKAFLDSQKAKSVRDLDEMQRFELKRELHSVLFDPFS